ncbi:hypothetical protein [Flavobacterium sp.]|uniref:hypothetical protein n=1 Tax=Flavobacterium sp. TaxID=239 RepID=UPI00352927C4
MNFKELIEKVKQIPYGRNSNRTDFSLILTENKGTCSSKHAFLKDFADKNDIENVKLYIGIFKMNEQNTPKIAPILSQNKLDYIPEAHCYLRVNTEVIDVTTQNSLFETIKNDILEEIEIQPEQVIDFKVNYHQDFLRNWLKTSHQTKTFNEVWKIREECITKLSTNI